MADRFYPVAGWVHRSLLPRGNQKPGIDQLQSADRSDFRCILEPPCRQITHRSPL